VFDVSFSELFVIAVVALLVIGPEKLPKVARTMGAFMGRMQRYAAQVKEEVNREVRFEELQKLQQEIKQSVENNLVKPIEQKALTMKASIHEPSSLAKTKAEVIETEIKTKSAAKKRGTVSNAKSKITKSSVAKRVPKPAVSATKTATKIK
jgi:sec-independent protein translocase protein TatB